VKGINQDVLALGLERNVKVNCRAVGRVTQLSGMSFHLCFTSISPQGEGAVAGPPSAGSAAARTTSTRTANTGCLWECIITRGRGHWLLSKLGPENFMNRISESLAGKRSFYGTILSARIEVKV
jgi:hypothetical protein